MAIIMSALVSAGGLARSFGQSSYLYTTNLFPVADATIFLQQSNINYGLSNTLTVGVADNGTVGRALLQFDVSSLPANATITNVLLTLFETPEQEVFGVYNIATVNTNWVENQVTWNNRSAASSWINPGGDFTPSFGQEGALLSSLASQITFYGDNMDSSFGMAHDVQAWINDPAVNFGWILYGSDETTPDSAAVFGSRESSFFDQPGAGAPMLSVAYTLPFAPPVLKVLTPTNGQFNFSFNVEPFHGYQIQTNNDLTTTNWHSFLVLDPPPTPTNVTLNIPLTPGQNFVRILTH
jgi:hypothetical protein